jgi:uncharacterized membrane protein YhhN
LLLCIIGYYVVSADKISVLLLLALITSWLGDVLLIPKGHKWFRIGGTSFLISHYLFILVYVPEIQWSGVKWLIVAALAAVYITISMKVIQAVKPTTPATMIKAMYNYLLTNNAMNIFALMRLMSLGSAGGWLAYIGAVLFFTSDCTLFFVRCYSKPEVIFKKHFTVMLTYVVGEFLITLGMLLG